MVEYLFKNEAVGTLDSAIGTGDTILFLETGEGANFPAISGSQVFRALIFDESLGTTEWVTVTAVSGDQLTVTRSASPQSFVAGAKVELRIEEEAMTNMLQKGEERTVTSDPDGSLTALYTGEEVYQSVTGVWWKHTTGLTWKEMNL